jgi:SAM-dependent methyltransferase
MLDMAKLTPEDYVIDLGSGDGRNIIAAARRGARGHGVEYNPDMVTLARQLAREAGVSERATFVQGDMYEADISKATVMALFLLPHNLERLKDKMLALPPGTRIVMNTFTLPGWEADETSRLETDCSSWCTALLHIVPARAGGRWRIEGGGELTLTQEFQKVSGTLTGAGSTGETVSGRLTGRALTMTVAGTTLAGRVEGDRIAGTATAAGGASRAWAAVRAIN